jgi:hypothetical protein
LHVRLSKIYFMVCIQTLSMYNILYYFTRKI